MLKPNSSTAWGLLLGAWGVGRGMFESPELYLIAPSLLPTAKST